jgi:DNA-binding GntR family transcriptional regulator
MTFGSTSIQRIEPPSSLRTTVERAVSAAIVSGEFAPGMLVTVPNLAAQFAVSATPVREAMLDLEKRGFVESVRNKGFRVTEVSERDLRDIVAVRQLLEGPAIRSATLVFPQQRLAEFRDLAEHIVTTAAQPDLAGYLRADSAFHLELLAVNGNRRLVAIVDELRKQTRMVGLAQLIDTVELKKSAAEHHRLLDLMSAGDADAAQALMYSHIGHVIGWWSGRSENDSATPAPG